MQIPPFNSDGLLPVGRFSCTITEARNLLLDESAFKESETRGQIWSSLLEFIEDIHSLEVKIISLFVSGTFCSTKLNPPDIDFSIIYAAESIRTPEEWAAFDAVIQSYKRSDPRLLDCYPLPWVPRGVGFKWHEPEYFCYRGAWDDFWQRNVPKDERTSPHRSHSIPLRGYLEVMVDGYE